MPPALFIGLLAERIIWAYWIHRSLLLAGGFKVSLIFWFSRPADGYLCLCYCSIVPWLEKWHCRRFKINLGADFKRKKQQTILSFVSRDYSSLRCTLMLYFDWSVISALMKVVQVLLCLDKLHWRGKDLLRLGSRDIRVCHTYTNSVYLCAIAGGLNWLTVRVKTSVFYLNSFFFFYCWKRWCVEYECVAAFVKVIFRPSVKPIRWRKHCEIISRRTFRIDPGPRYVACLVMSLLLHLKQQNVAASPSPPPKDSTTNWVLACCLCWREQPSIVITDEHLPIGTSSFFFFDRTPKAAFPLWSMQP